MRGFKEILESYGSNYEETMGRFLGDEAFYLRMLGMLLKDGSMKTLCDALNGEDMGAAFDAAHTLKGIAGNLGLTPFYSAVCTMVETLRIRDPEGEYLTLYQCMADEYIRVERLWGELSEL